MTVEQIVRYTRLVREYGELNPADADHDEKAAPLLAEIRELRKVIDAEHARRARR